MAGTISPSFAWVGHPLHRTSSECSFPHSPSVATNLLWRPHRSARSTKRGRAITRAGWRRWSSRQKETSCTPHGRLRCRRRLRWPVPCRRGWKPELGRSSRAFLRMLGAAPAASPGAREQQLLPSVSRDGSDEMPAARDSRIFFSSLAAWSKSFFTSGRSLLCGEDGGAKLERQEREVVEAAERALSSGMTDEPHCRSADGGFLRGGRRGHRARARDRAPKLSSRCSEACLALRRYCRLFAALECRWRTP